MFLEHLKLTLIGLNWIQNEIFKNKTQESNSIKNIEVNFYLIK